jgi:hypothetical protein
VLKAGAKQPDVGAAVVDVFAASFNSSESSNSHDAWLPSVLRRLESRYPVLFDTLLALHVPAATASCPWPRALLTLCASPLRQPVTLTTSTTSATPVGAGPSGSLAVALAHPQAAVRFVGLTTLLASLTTQEAHEHALAESDRELLALRLEVLLSDPDLHVFGATLALGAHLVAYVAPEVIFERVSVRFPSLAPAMAATAARLLTGPFLAANPSWVSSVAAFALARLLPTPSAAAVCACLLANFLGGIFPLTQRSIQKKIIRKSTCILITRRFNHRF